jgi:hypothetical protein
MRDAVSYGATIADFSGVAKGVLATSGTFFRDHSQEYCYITRHLQSQAIRPFPPETLVAVRSYEGPSALAFRAGARRLLRWRRCPDLKPIQPPPPRALPPLRSRAGPWGEGKSFSSLSGARPRGKLGSLEGFHGYGMGSWTEPKGRSDATRATPGGGFPATAAVT